ncbi:MAG: hypothetical protein M5U26_06050 [Planctomycetota bacterium]|nr:hypothetical protein [Planctomycetota bacterium]
MSRIGLAPALCLAVLLSDTPVFAQMLPDADPVPLWDQLERAYQRGDFQRVVALSRKAIVDMPTMPAPRYELACGLAMLGNKNAALEALAEALALGFHDPAQLREEEYLKPLHDEPLFWTVVKDAREMEQLGKAEPGPKLEGVRTLEDFPEGGLRYRLHMSPEATPQKPQRLLVWLHPTGESMNDRVELLAPRLNKLGLALAVFTQKPWNGWQPEDAMRMIKRTLPALAKVPGVDGKRPYLFGFSAGGQLALTLWSENPERYAGMILDAAYPISSVHYGPDSMGNVRSPTAPGHLAAPLFVAVGTKDSGARLWQRVAPRWKKAGVNLTYHPVPERGHEYFFEGAALDAVEAWLRKVLAGERPSDYGPLLNEQPVETTLTPEERAEHLNRLALEFREAYGAGDFEGAASLARSGIALMPQQPYPYWALARALAQMKHLEEALSALDDAVERGFSNTAALREDQGLASLHGKERFERLLKAVREKETQGTPEPAPKLEGVKVVEDHPEGGFRFRLYLHPQASRPQPLIVWLHPKGASLCGTVEPFAPRLTQAGFALLVPTMKAWTEWQGQDLERLMRRTLPALGTIPNVDFSAPILWGQGDGAQAALALWSNGLGPLGGLILGAAPPTEDQPPGAQAAPNLLSPPLEDANRRAPLFALVGEKSPSAAAWAKAATLWRSQGVPLALNSIPERGDEWLFDDARFDELLKWLAKLPVRNP